MKKLRASIAKEVQLLWHDKIGLLLLYLMPLLLVFIITIVQDSTFRLVNENRLELVVSNHDKGELGDTLIDILRKSGSFDITVENTLSQNEIQAYILDENQLAGIYIPHDFSQKLASNAGHVTRTMLNEFGLSEDSTHSEIQPSELSFYFDPVMQENFQHTLTTSLRSILYGIENQRMISELFYKMGYDEVPEGIAGEMERTQTHILSAPASSGSGSTVIPNSSQHNVPAWSIFAMFFMVISLGGNLVKERLSGSFIRLRTIPPAFSLTIISKMVLFLFVAISQLTLLFLIGVCIFPLIGLPQLEIPSTWLQLIVISVLSALAAVSYAILVGTYARTQEQANGFGAISIIIFAAIGGIWVPTFVMPEYLQYIAKISPLYWCLDGYYTLFLKNGNWNDLSGPVIFLILFTFACQILTYIKLKIQHYI